MRKNAEGLRIFLFIFLGIYLAEKFGFGLFLKVRKHKKSYYAKLIPYNSFYYRFKSTFRYVYVISLIPVLILFLFGKDMISAKIAQKPEGLFPYDFVCMATEADETFWKQLQEKYSDVASIYRSEPYFIEIMPKDVNKATSLDHMLEGMGLTRENAICCGDGYNDISMIEYAGTGVAMGNAQLAVKDAADYITGTNDEDGLVEVIDKFIMNPEQA